MLEALPTPIGKRAVAPAPVPGFGGGVRELRSLNLNRELAITLVARKFSISLQTQKVQAHHAPVPGSVAAMLLLPIPVAFPKIKNGLPEHG